MISGLPAFLAKDPGLDSGHMITHCTAAALVSENKVLCHPASVDTISTSASKEDHVSMGGFAARKALSVVENTERVIAIEIICAIEGEREASWNSIPGTSVDCLGFESCPRAL